MNRKYYKLLECGVFPLFSVADLDKWELTEDDCEGEKRYVTEEYQLFPRDTIGGYNVCYTDNGSIFDVDIKDMGKGIGYSEITEDEYKKAVEAIKAYRDIQAKIDASYKEATEKACALLKGLI